ncbi:HNH endonuclease family protein [Georgenia sp. H159]|uniref:HNH endonuclease family protein n=1 Tax=Georgenia sp. H159 TaxID=3076115 RepID=UPI002D76773C|nr:HNH endonuclease family protein [Georgenia sp. H159]
MAMCAEPAIENPFLTTAELARIKALSPYGPRSILPRTVEALATRSEMAAGSPLGVGAAPSAWQEMLGGKEVAAQVQEEHRHRLGNLTITAYNSNLGNKSFIEKRDREDSKGRYIGYRNGLSLNTELATRDSWTADDIDERSTVLANKVIERFPLA